MPKRGPKPRTEANSRATAPGAPIDWAGYELPPETPAGAKAEFFRLAGVLREKGTLERTDPSVLLNLARITDLLDRACIELATDQLTITSGNGSLCANPLISIVNSLTIRRRGLMNDLGLTPASSRHSGTAKGHSDEKPEDPVRRYLKISG